MRGMRWNLVPVVCLLAGMPQAAPAQDLAGWAVSASLGASEMRDKDGADTFQGSALGFTAEVEYRFTSHFSLGVGGFSLGRAEDDYQDTRTEISVRGFELFGRAILPLTDRAELYGRVGAAHYFADIDPGSAGFAEAIFGDDAEDLGIGLDFGRRESLAWRIEARFYNGGDDETGRLLTFGFNYLF